jgi:hypothetical protein
MIVWINKQIKRFLLHRSIKMALGKENIMLVAVACVGVIGLVALQIAKKSTAENRDKVLVQTQQAQATQSSTAVQKIPGELIRTSEHPEAGKPFRFLMAKYAQGATYELEFADGKRKPFTKEGYVQHTFSKEGLVRVTLFARFDGQEIRLDTLHRIVARKAIKSEVAPIIDY